MESWDELLTLLRAYRQPELIFAAVEFDIFTQLRNGSLGADTLAQKSGADPRGMRMLLNALVAIGLLQKTADGYANTPLGNDLLNAHALGNKLNAVHLMQRSRQRWFDLVDIIRTGGPPADEAKAFRDDADANRTFIGAMHDIGFTNGVAIAEGMDLSSYRHLLDVGGGPASYSIAFLERYPAMSATLADLPLTLEVARKNIDTYGMSGRISLVETDLYAKERFDFGGSFDLVLVSNLIHMAAVDENMSLFARLTPHLEPGGMLIVHDAFISEDRTKPIETALFAVDMLLATEHGDCYTYNEVAAWLQQAGLVDIRPVEGIFERPSLLVGRKPGSV